MTKAIRAAYFFLSVANCVTKKDPNHPERLLHVSRRPVITDKMFKLSEDDWCSF